MGVELLVFGWSYITHGYLHKNTNMTKKVKSDFIGKYITVYLNGREVSFTISEDTANEADFWTEKGIGHIFEEVEPNSKKFKGVEPESDEA